MSPSAPHVLLSFTLGVIVFPAKSRAQDPFGPPVPYAVQVTPKSLVANRAAGGGTLVDTFWVQNIGTQSDIYTISCWGTGVIACTGTSQSSVSLAATQQAVITATYTRSAGTGTLWLKAVGTFGDDNVASDSGSYAITVGAPLVDASSYNFASQSYSRCAAACFAVV